MTISYSIIDTKTEKKTFGVWPFEEKVKTTLKLVYYEEKIGIVYEAEYSGLKKGHVSGGPIEVAGNIDIVVHKDPPVRVIISNWSYTSTHISMHVAIVVTMAGKDWNIFNKTLGGEIPAQDPVIELAAGLKESVKSAGTA